MFTPIAITMISLYIGDMLRRNPGLAGLRSPRRQRLLQHQEHAARLAKHQEEERRFAQECERQNVEFNRQFEEWIESEAFQEAAEEHLSRRRLREAAREAGLEDIHDDILLSDEWRHLWDHVGGAPWDRNNKGD